MWVCDGGGLGGCGVTDLRCCCFDFSEDFVFQWGGEVDAADLGTECWVQFVCFDVFEWRGRLGLRCVFCFRHVALDEPTYSYVV